MIDGVLSGKFRERGLEYDIRVQLKEEQKDIMEAFNSTYINNVNGKLVKLSNISFPRKAEGPSQIYRKDRSVFVSVEGNLAKNGAIGNITKDVFRIFHEEKAKPENESWKHIEIRPAGNAEEMQTMMQSIMFEFVLSIVFMFLILASLYESVITPITIMTALPLAIIGGFVALFLAKRSIDMFTLIGMIMLLGIVAKNSILLVDYIQQKIKAGLEIEKAIEEAGKIRLRPILMTTFAIIGGMLPTALGLSEIGNFRKGMGIVVIGGVISSTLLTLLIVPAVFEYLDKFRRWTRKIIGRPENRLVDCSDRELKEKGFAE
jgi:HAE1 family hydrophobic/amphiphilic exporter-1